MLGGLKDREVLPILPDPILGGLKERELPPKLLLPKLGLPLKLLDPCNEPLLVIGEPLLKLRVIPGVELLGNTRAESILENDPEGAWRIALLMLFRIATSLLFEARVGRFVIERVASKLGFIALLPVLLRAAERTLAPRSFDLVATDEGEGSR